jgi:hypothetical protein
MANLALIRGAGIAAPKFTDLRTAVQPGINTFKNVMSLRQKEADKLEAEKKRQDNLKANDYKSLGALQTDGVPKPWMQFFDGVAVDVKKENNYLVNQKGKIDQFEYIDGIRKQQQVISNLQNSIGAIQQYSADYAQIIEDEDLSDSLTAKELKNINDIVELKGKPVYKNDGVYFVTEDGDEFAISDLPKLKKKETPLHLEINKGLESVINTGGSKGMFRDSQYLQEKIDTYLNDTKITGKQAKSLAIDFLGMGGKDGNFADIFNDLTGGKLDDIDGDGDIDKDDYIKSFANIKSDDDFVRRIKNEYKKIALNGSDNLKTEYDRINKVKAEQSKGKGDLTKYQFDELMRQKELQTISVSLKPLSKFLSAQPINETQAKSLIEYANNTIPGIEIYQNNQTDDDGNLLNPNAYVIEVNGERKPFIIGKTSGMSIDKFIKDLFGYTANDRLSMFGVEDNEETKDEFSEYKEESPRYKLEQKAIEDITSGRYDRNKALKEKLAEEKENDEIDTLKRNFKAGKITQEYLTGPGKAIYDNWKKTGGEIDLSLRSN